MQQHGSPKPETYAAILRERMETSENPTGHPITLRQLSKDLGYSYEHIRKVLRGEPVTSPELNERLCKALGLDPVRMRRVAEREKIRRRWQSVPGDIAPADLQQTWSRLSEGDRLVLQRVAEAMTAPAASTRPIFGIPVQPFAGGPISFVPVTLEEADALLAGFQLFADSAEADGGDNPVTLALYKKLQDAGVYGG